MFNKILIANRGEIACRIIKSARMLGIRTVAVYSTADAKAQHVTMADEAYFIGPAPASESYLVAEKIIEVATTAGAEAIHPGYGFLSENADFAKQCQAANIVFIGPPVAAIEAMGSKSAAKEIMAAANVPMVPGYYGDDQSEERLMNEAQSIGYPVLIKACAGGGGKGMRIVESANDFSSALQSCQREAKASFNDDKVLIEKYLTSPRHIEIQIFLDSQQNAVHLFERDCSVQRRYQKVIEEAPAPNFPDEMRQEMGRVAIQAAKAINYVGAGTVEFLYDNGQFYFMEMNTRLQVEHPITEKITGVDLVEWQLIVAFGGTLPKQQQELSINGHAFEVRLYAEDPAQDFLPSTGIVEYMNTPSTTHHVRIDSGIRQGDVVSVYYDPMIAKLIVWDSNRERALSRLIGALSEYQVVGVETNLTYTKAIALHDEFQSGHYSTAFIKEHAHELVEDHQLSELDFAMAALFIVCRDKDSAIGNQPESPWHSLVGWQNNLVTRNKFYFITDRNNPESENTEVVIGFRKDHYHISVNGLEFMANAQLDNHQLQATLSQQKITRDVIESANTLHMFSHGRHVRIQQYQPGNDNQSENQSARIVAPMHGSVTAVHVSEGEEVVAGQKLLTMEAMKMEHVIAAPYSGIIKSIHCTVGDLVEDGLELVTFSDDE